MKDLKDRWHEFNIACTILDTNPNQKAKDWGVSRTAVELSARGAMKSSKMRSRIINTIKEAKKVVPFSYPSNGQTNGQLDNSEKHESEAA